MIIPLIFVAALSFFRLDFSPHLTQIARPFQDFCLRRTRNFQLSELTGNIVCGSPEMSLERRKDFLKTGTYHLLVVSGAHFTTLLLMFRGLPKGTAIFPLGAFLLLSGAGAPALRALFHLAVTAVSRSLRFHWSWIDCVILSTGIVLSLFCSLFSAKALLLSVICATIFQAPTKSSRGAQISKTFASAFIAGAVMATWSATHPLGWLVGACLSPMIELFLFPLCLLEFVCPLLSPWINPIVLKFSTLVGNFASVLPESSAGTSIPHTLSWALLFLSFTIFLWRQRRCQHIQELQ